MQGTSDPSKRVESFWERFPALSRLILVGPLRKRIPVIRQLTAADCGAAALAMALRFHGRIVRLDQLRDELGTGRNGTSATAILEVARAYGLKGSAVKAELEGLRSIPSGSILFWEFRHFVVFEKFSSEGVHIVDPAIGRRFIRTDQLRKSFTGVALVLEPGEGFAKGGDRSIGFKTVLLEVLSNKGLVFHIVLTSILAELLSMVLPLLTGFLVDKVIPRRDYSMLLISVVAYSSMQAFSVLAAFMRATLFIHLQTYLQMKFTLRFLDHLMDLPFSFFRQRTSGDIMVRLNSNTAIKDILTGTMFSAMLDGLLASAYIVILFATNAVMTFFLLLIAAIRITAMIWMRSQQKELLSESLAISSSSSTSSMEILSGIETLKAMGLERSAVQNWSNIFVDGLNVSIRQQRLTARFEAAMSLLAIFSTLGTLFYGAYLVLEGVLSVGTMLAFNALAFGFLNPLNKLVASMLQLQSVEVYLERINDVLESPREQDTASPSLGTLSGQISVERVSFQYDGGAMPVLREVSIEIESGSRVAFVGQTGSGKSTLAHIIAGLDVPSNGRICYDGRDLSALDRRFIRRQLGIVTQDSQLFSGSIRHNIALSDAYMPFEKIVHAARIACIHEDIVSMPMGYETVLVDRGMALSGGQRQRLAIARAIVNHPRILILDEATSSLDFITEGRVCANLATLKCTCIVIAHRLQTIREADLIVVLDNGKIIESGNHEELSRTGGPYSALLRHLNP